MVWNGAGLSCLRPNISAIISLSVLNVPRCLVIIFLTISSMVGAWKKIVRNIVFAHQNRFQFFIFEVLMVTMADKERIF